MPRLPEYAVPHLWGRLDYSVLGRLQPDGDTIHSREPRLLFAGPLCQRSCPPLRSVLKTKARTS